VPDAREQKHGYGTVPENVQLPASKTVQNIGRENRLASKSKL